MKNVFHMHFDDKIRQAVITANKGLLRQPFIYSHKRDEMYRKNLQKNHVDLVDMQVVFQTITNTLNQLNEIDKLTESMYEQVVAVFDPFINSSDAYSVFKDFLKDDVAFKF